MVQSGAIPGNYMALAANRPQQTSRNPPRAGLRFAFATPLLNKWLPVVIALFLMFIVPNKASGQGLEITGGWAHVTKDFGTDGFNVGADWWLWRRVALGGEYDSAWDTSIIGNFTLTTIPAFTFRTHLQNYLFGPRIFFRNEHAEKHRLEPFAEVEFGGSHLNQTVEQTGFSSASGASSGFSWMFGGGVDYMLTSHWFGRGRLDFLRTHFVDEGQNRLRFVVEIGYTFGERERKK